MNTITVVYFFLAILFSFLIVYFQYFFKEKKYSNQYILALLRWITLLSVFTLLINPKIERKRLLTVKPTLVIAVDNSESISFNKQDSTVRALSNDLLTNKDLNKKFRVSSFSFGSTLKNSSKFTFQESKTNIYTALTELNSLFKNQTTAIVLISDGNQTYGNDYKYIKSDQKVFPIIIGDTLQALDMKIDRLNVNAFSYLNNNFPVEVFIQFNGNEEVRSKFTVEEKNRIVFSKNMIFSKDKKSEVITFKLPAKSTGKHLYRAYIKPFKNENNTKNNAKIFSVEVFNEQSNIGIVYDLLHPDIGMFKRSIESNKQRKVHLIDLNSKDSIQVEKDVYILYQPNSKFISIFKKIQELKKSYFIVTGTQTDWNFLNKIQKDFNTNMVQTTEEYFPVFNSKFNTFYTEDIGFSEFPPLVNNFGTVRLSTSSQKILSNSVNNMKLDSPMLVVYSNENNRRVILFGENIWKWRVNYYQNNKSFIPFDRFINSLIQYLTIHKKKTPIELNYKSYFYAKEEVIIKAKTYDANFNFDRNAELNLKIKGMKESIPFVLTGFDYEASVPNLQSGNYEFEVKDGKSRRKSKGAFTVGKFSVEQEVDYANIKGLNQVALNANGKSFYPNQKDKLIELLLQNNSFVSTQKEETTKGSFIDWKWLLGLIVVSLTLEWFIRKYRGLT